MERSETAKKILSAIEQKEAIIGVMGLGYVGLPLAVTFAQEGFRVVGFDVDADKAAQLNAGASYIDDVPNEDVAHAVSSGRLSATTDMGQLNEPDVICICVPTPLRKTRDPDMSYITQAVEAIAKVLRAGQLVILESTTYPGTTEEFIAPTLTAKGLVLGENLFLGASPERVDPGQGRWTIKNTPKVVGGVTETCRELSAALYAAAVDTVVPVGRPTAAELTKLYENTFRAVNIGLANEMAHICHHLGLDVWEIVDAAASKPFGFMPFYPGPGIGGHCIPVDPLYLTWKLRSKNVQSRFIDLADEFNRSMPEYVATRAMFLLNKQKLSVHGARVFVLGVAYKKNVSDVRESPALDVIQRLQGLGAQISYHDPYVPEVSIGGETLCSAELSSANLEGADLVLILTAHDAFDRELIAKNSGQILDTRNLMKSRAGNIERI